MIVHMHYDQLTPTIPTKNKKAKRSPVNALGLTFVLELQLFSNVSHYKLRVHKL